MLIKPVIDLAETVDRIIPLKRGEYISPAPAYANLSDVVPRWRSEQENILYRGHASLPQAHLIEVSNAILFANGRIMTAGGSVIMETLHNGKLDEEPNLEPLRQEDRLTMVLRKPGDSNYGHWLLEICPRVREFQEHYPENDWMVAISPGPANLMNIMVECLANAGVSPDRIMRFEGSPTRFRRLAFITSNSIHSHTHDPGAVAFMRRILKVPAANKGFKRLFVAREQGIRRHLLNEEAVAAALHEAGFETVYPERLSLAEQVATFSKASVVVGVCGAALTNLMFAPRDCKTLCLQPNHGHEFFFWDIANILGQPFSFLFGDASDPVKAGHSDFSVDINLLNAWLS